MTDMDAACIIKELAEYNKANLMLTPQMHQCDTICSCAFDHAIRALEERAGARNPVYSQNPNGTWSVRTDD